MVNRGTFPGVNYKLREGAGFTNNTPTLMTVVPFKSSVILYLRLSQTTIKKGDKLSRMYAEFISAGVASLVVMSIVMFCIINISLVVFIIQSTPWYVPVVMPPQRTGTAEQRPLVITPRFGNRPIPQENDEWLC